MSLSSFVEEADVRERLKPLRPRFPRKIPLPLVAPPRSGRFQVVGIAFDYLFRFEVERRAARCTSRGWVAEHAPDLLRDAARGSVSLKLLMPDGPALSLPPPGGFARAARRAQRALDAARDVFVDYVLLGTPSDDEVADAAAVALRLAKLDLVFRAGCFDPDFDRADREDVEDLLAMLAVVPFGSLLGKKMIHLNPTFGEASHAVGGADADMIVGDMLVELKASKQDKVRAEDLDQLLGYFLLTRRAHRANRRFPVIRRLSLYYARFAYLATFEVTTWTEHPLFLETEEWFFDRAENLAAELEEADELDLDSVTEASGSKQ